MDPEMRVSDTDQEAMLTTGLAEVRACRASELVRQLRHQCGIYESTHTIGTKQCNHFISSQ